MSHEIFNDIMGDLIEKKVKERKDSSRPISILELAAGRTYGEKDYNYGTPWLSRLSKIKYGDAVDISICDTVNDWASGSPPGAIEDIEPVVFFEKNGVLNIEEGATFKASAKSAGPESLMPTKEFSPIAESDGQRFFVRPRLDPVFEKMVFGLNAYGHTDMNDNKSIRASLGIAEKTFDIIFAKNAYNLPSAEQISDLLSEDGLYIAGGFYKGHLYHPITRLAEKHEDKLGNSEVNFQDRVNDYLWSQGLLPRNESIYPPYFTEKEGRRIRKELDLSMNQGKPYQSDELQRKIAANRNQAEELAVLARQGAEMGIKQL
jgi:hypothetical protein